MVCNPLNILGLFDFLSVISFKALAQGFKLNTYLFMLRRAIVPYFSVREFCLKGLSKTLAKLAFTRFAINPT